MDLREELSRAHRGQQGLPVFPEQGCKFIRPETAEQSLLFGWRNPKAQRWKGEKGKKLQTSLKSPLARERESNQEVGDPNLPEGTHGKWRERHICSGLSNAPEGQEMRRAVHYPGVSPKIRVILMSSNQSPDGRTDGKEVGRRGSWLLTLLPARGFLTPLYVTATRGVVTSPDAQDPLRETRMHLVWRQAEWNTVFFFLKKALQMIPMCVNVEKHRSICESKDLKLRSIVISQILFCFVLFFFLAFFVGGNGFQTGVFKLIPLKISIRKRRCFIWKSNF